VTVGGRWWNPVKSHLLRNGVGVVGGWGWGLGCPLHTSDDDASNNNTPMNTIINVVTAINPGIAVTIRLVIVILAVVVVTT